MTIRPTTWTRKTRIAGACGGAVLAVGIGCAAYAFWGGSPRGTSRHFFFSTASAAPTAKQTAAAAYDYPAPGASLPRSITINYDAAKDRTAMTLELKGLACSAPSGYRVSNLDLKVVSEYAGTARRPGAGELSVRGVLSGTCSPAGVLAPSSPVAVFTADGHAIDARDPAGHANPYGTEKKPGGPRESLEFRLATKDLISISASKSVSAKAGMLTVTFTPSQLALLREFAARMNPKP